MTKRISTLILALLLPLAFLISGCSLERMTRLDYYNETDRCWKEFMDTNTELTGGLSTKDALLPNFRLGNDDDIARLKEIVARRNKALSDFEKLRPPKEYKDQHKEIVKGIKLEYKWNEALLDLANAKTEADRDKVSENLTAVLDTLPYDSYFPFTYAKLAKQLREDIGLDDPW